MRKTLLHVLLIIITGLLIYSNTLNSPFLWDDYPRILENGSIRNQSKVTDCSGTRYLTVLTFSLNYMIGGFNVTGFHMFNIVVHIGNAVLIYSLLLTIFKTPLFKETPFSGHSGTLALLSGLLFVSHPVYTQTVTYISQRSTVLVTFFYLSSLVLFMRAKLSDRRCLSKGHLPYYLMSVISAAFAMKCKEISFTLPIVILLSDRFFYGARQSFKKSVIYALPILLTILIIPLSKPQTDFFGRQATGVFKIEGGAILSDFNSAKLSSLSTIPRGKYILTQFRVIMTYIRLSFLPFNLNLAYDYPIYHSVFESQILLSCLFLLSLLSISICLFKRSRKTLNCNNLLISFGIFWFFITLSVESFIVVLNYVIFEYRLYLPSIGLLFLLMGILGYVIPHFGKFKYISAVIIIVVIIFSGATFARNEVFKDEMSLWKDVINKAPNNVQAHNNLGLSMFKRGLIDKAVEEYKAAIRINPYYAEPYNNLGTLLNRKGLPDDAIEQYKTALRIRPDYSEAYGNLGFTYYFYKGRPDKAIEQYQIALEFNPNDATTHLNIGIAYRTLGLSDKSREHFAIAKRLNPALFKVE